MESEIKQKTKHNTLSGQIKTHENLYYQLKGEFFKLYVYLFTFYLMTLFVKLTIILLVTIHFCLECPKWAD
jgi:hypothetical protein